MNRPPMPPRSLADVLAELPPMCAAHHPTTGKPILLRRGEYGYWPAMPGLDVDAYNARHGVTPAQREAMLAGSLPGSLLNPKRRGSPSLPAAGWTISRRQITHVTSLARVSSSVIEPTTLSIVTTAASPFCTTLTAWFEER